MTNAPNRGELWGAAEAYEGYTWAAGAGGWRRSSPGWLGAAPRGRWVDLGCGTGALAAEVCRACQPESLLGLDTSGNFLRAAGRQVPGATFRVGNAADTGLPSGTFDHAVSGLVLNFTPDPSRTLREMARIVRPGGGVALYVWDYAGHMQIMRAFFNAARPIDPGSVAFDDGVNVPICRCERRSARRGSRTWR